MPPSKKMQLEIDKTLKRVNDRGYGDRRSDLPPSAFRRAKPTTRGRGGKALWDLWGRADRGGRGDAAEQ